MVRKKLKKYKINADLSLTFIYYPDEKCRSVLVVSDPILFHVHFYAAVKHRSMGMGWGI